MSPAYFLDRMTLDEASAFIDGWETERREKWEMTRRMMYAVFQSQSTRELEPEDVMGFPWDVEEEDSTADPEMNIEELRKEALRIEKIMSRQ